MKKIFIIIALLFGITGFSFADDLSSYIQKNYEYVDFGDQFIINQSYKSSKGKQYYFWGNLSVYPISTQQEAQSLASTNNDTIFAFSSQGTRAFQKSANKFDISQCTKISLNEKIFFDAYQDMIKISDSQSILGGSDGNLQCYTDGQNAYIAQNSFQDSDLNYLIKNFSYLKKRIDNIKIDNLEPDKNTNILKNLYKYVMDNTSYNYDYLKYDLNSLKDDSLFYPWRVQGFFDGKKLVCGGYSLVYSFLANLYGIKAQLLYGDIQSIDKKRLNLGDAGHNRVKIGDLYYDPTFDDADDKLSYDYFGKNKTCFNLDHYTTGWVSFQDASQRFGYIKTNFENLWTNCPSSTANTLLADNTIIDLTKRLLQNYDLDTSKEFLCKSINLCNINSQTKDDFLEYLKLVTLKFGDREINIGQSLGSPTFSHDQTINISPEKPTYTGILNMTGKYSINGIISNIKTKYKGKDIQNFYDKNKKAIQSILNSSKLTNAQRLKIQYLNDVFLVENLK